MQHCAALHPVFRCGDFNVDMRCRCQEYVLKGEVPLSEIGRRNAAAQCLELPSSLRFETGFRSVRCHGALGTLSEHLALHWKTSDGSTKILRDAIEGINCLEGGPGPSPDGPVSAGQETISGQHIYGSSHNAARVETIDYVWVDTSHLEVLGRSSLVTTMPDGMPDSDNPSDHIPLLVRLHWKQQELHG